MIITRIDCGMGNQMFAYSAGFVTAKRLNTEILLDLYWYEKKQPRKDPRPYSLECFPKIHERAASFSEIYKLFPFQAVINHIYSRKNIFYSLSRHSIRQIMNLLMLLPEGRARRKFLNSDPLLLPIPASRVFTQEGSRYSGKFKLIPDDTYIWGGFQSEKFFAGYEHLIREQFTFAPEYFRNSQCEKIRSCNSVAIHVRLGDKLRHGEVDFTLKYIRHSLERIFTLTEKPEFFVFSDNIKICKDKLPEIYDAKYNFIEGNSPPQDMALITQCRHVITGPSTFSWWGAWLNDNPAKIVIAPAQKLWCSDRELACYQELYPSEWLVID
ncbi:MAG: alpha-1,2-fucosyltransferase [Synergistaceae bacterium]|nr:alpha-1,2-fucosyltransferase [Synergistaceae bacterium]